MPLEDSVPAQKNEEEEQENKSSRHNSVTAAVSNGQTTSQALTEVTNKRKQAESQSTASHLFALTRSLHRPTFIRPDASLHHAAKYS